MEVVIYKLGFKRAVGVSQVNKEGGEKIILLGRRDSTCNGMKA